LSGRKRFAFIAIDKQNQGDDREDANTPGRQTARRPPMIRQDIWNPTSAAAGNERKKKKKQKKKKKKKCGGARAAMSMIVTPSKTKSGHHALQNADEHIGETRIRAKGKDPAVHLHSRCGQRQREPGASKFPPACTAQRQNTKRSTSEGSIATLGMKPPTRKGLSGRCSRLEDEAIDIHRTSQQFGQLHT